MERTPEEINALLDKFEDFMKSYEDADNEYQTNQRRENWKSKYGERFKPYEDKIKLLNGDGFDLMEESRNEYESQYSDLTDDEYCNALENNIKATLQRIWPDAEPEQIEQATEEVKEVVDDKAATETPEGEADKEKAPEDTETTTTTEETLDDEGNKEVEVTEETKPEEEEEEEKEEEKEDPLDSFTKELEKTKESLPKRK